MIRICLVAAILGIVFIFLVLIRSYALLLIVTKWTPNHTMLFIEVKIVIEGNLKYLVGFENNLTLKHNEIP